MTEAVDFYFSFRSPYSYLAAPRAFALPERYAIELRTRAVLPMVMRGVPAPQSKAIALFLDAAREAERLGMPFGPIHDPLGEGAKVAIAVAHHALGEGLLEAWILRASRAVWAEGVELADRGELLRLAEEAGLDREGCRRALSDPAQRGRAEAWAERDAAALTEAGAWGVPTWVFRGEPFWGQDRIVDLERRLREASLARS